MYILKLVVVCYRLCSVVEKTWVHMPKIAGSIPVRDTFFKFIGPIDQSDFFAYFGSDALFCWVYGPHHRIGNVRFIL